MSELFFSGFLKNCNGQKFPVEIKTEAWQSGNEDLPEKLRETASQKILFALSALSRKEEVVEEINDKLIAKGILSICAGSPPICWKPSNTIVNIKRNT